MNSIETYIYKDAEYSSVNFENIFNLFKCAMALENEKLIGLIITYLTLDENKLKTLFSDNKPFEYFVYLIFDFWQFLEFSIRNNYINKNNLSELAYTLVSTIINNIFEFLISEDSFKSFLNSLGSICQCYPTNVDYITEVLDKITTLLVSLPNSKLSIENKIAYFELAVKHMNLNTPDDKKNYLQSHFNIFILGEKPTFNDSQTYEKYLNAFKINDEALIKKINKNIILQGYSLTNDLNTDFIKVKGELRELSESNKSLQNENSILKDQLQISDQKINELEIKIENMNKEYQKQNEKNKKIINDLEFNLTESINTMKEELNLKFQNLSNESILKTNNVDIKYQNLINENTMDILDKIKKNLDNIDALTLEWRTDIVNMDGTSPQCSSYGSHNFRDLKSTDLNGGGICVTSP